LRRSWPAVVLAVAVLSLVTGSASAAPSTAAVMADSPFGYWRLNDIAAAGPGAGDASGNAHQGQYIGASAPEYPGSPASPLAAGLGGGFIGTVAPATLGDFTAEGWVYANGATNGSVGTIFEIPNCCGNGLREGVDSLTGRVVVMTALDGGQFLPPALVGQTDVRGAWHHVALVRNEDAAGGSLTLYVDGVQEAQRTGGITADYQVYVSGFGPVVTWGSGIGGNDALFGRLDELALFTDALSPARVAAHAAARNGAPDCAAPVPAFVLRDTSAGLGASCADPDGDALRSGAVSGGPMAGASLVGTSPTTATYTPAPGYVGPDGFDFTVSDGQLSSPSRHVEIHVVSATASTGSQSASTGTEATAAEPVQVSVSSPVPGAVIVDPAPAGAGSAGWTVVGGREFQIEAPTPPAGQLLRLEFLLDASAFGAKDDLGVLRDGQPMAFTVEDAGGGDVRLIVLADHASRWQLAVRAKGGKGCGDKNHTHEKTGLCPSR
jgi:hypothetical protein